jgi:hypothetical protein
MAESKPHTFRFPEPKTLLSTEPPKGDPHALAAWVSVIWGATFGVLWSNCSFYQANDNDFHQLGTLEGRLVTGLQF